MPEPLHLLRIGAQDRSGTIELIAAAFSSRGISLDTLCAVRMGPDTRVRGHGISLAFRASRARHDQMVRILRRMACVESVDEVAVGSAGSFLPCHAPLAPRESTTP